jgi:hypothetical protein
MAMFTAHIAFILEIMALAAGLIALHYADRMQAKLIRIAGMILVIFALTGIACTAYYAAKYYSQGAYEYAYTKAVE